MKLLNKTVTVVSAFFLVASMPGLSYIHTESGDDAKDSGLVLYSYPSGSPASERYKVKINDREAFVYFTTAGSFVAFESQDWVSVQVEMTDPLGEVRILPLRLGIEPSVERNILRFRMPPNEKVLLETRDREPLCLYANRSAGPAPDPCDDKVHYFESGRVHEVDELVLKDNETIYIEGGAVVHGVIRATSAQNVSVRGYGVLDGTGFRQRGYRGKFILFEDCRDVELEGIIMIEPPGWMVTLYHSEDIRIRDIKQLSYQAGRDGIDIVSSRRVRISNSMLRTGDDCIAVKSFRDKRYAGPVLNTRVGVNDVEVTGCSVQANLGGQAFEIGHELVLDPVTNIHIHDCDVLGSHGHSGVFGIRNCDGATVSNVLYENIRVDHYYDKLIDFRIVKSRWSRTDSIGHIRDITLRNIEVTRSIFNPGYSISVIGGYDATHKVENVTIENLYYNGDKVRNQDELELYTRQTENIIIK